MRHPYIRTAAAVATWLGVAGLVYDELSDLWTTVDPDSDFSVSDGTLCSVLLPNGVQSSFFRLALKLCVLWSTGLVMLHIRTAQILCVM